MRGRIADPKAVDNKIDKIAVYGVFLGLGGLLVLCALISQESVLWLVSGVFLWGGYKIVKWWERKYDNA